MGNKLGHGEVSNKAAASGSSADSQRPPSGTNSGEVPVPMEPMNPIPVSNSDKLGLPSGSNSSGLETVGSDPGTNKKSTFGTFSASYAWECSGCRLQNIPERGFCYHCNTRKPVLSNAEETLNTGILFIDPQSLFLQKLVK